MIAEATPMDTPTPPKSSQAVDWPELRRRQTQADFFSHAIRQLVNTPCGEIEALLIGARNWAPLIDDTLFLYIEEIREAWNAIEESIYNEFAPEIFDTSNGMDHTFKTTTLSNLGWCLNRFAECDDEELRDDEWPHRIDAIKTAVMEFKHCIDRFHLNRGAQFKDIKAQLRPRA